VRVSITLFVFIAACSSSDPDPMRGHHAAAVTSASATPARGPAPPGKPSGDDPTPTNDPPPAAPSASASTPPPADAGPPPMGSCANPTCADDGSGSFRCRATDSSGTDVQLDCESGDCACFTDYQLTTEQPGDIADVGDARTFFFANCQCL
jgi:hypothetical protein